MLFSLLAVQFCGLAQKINGWGGYAAQTIGNNIQKIIAAVDGFQKGEFGLAQSRGKLEVRGHEYGCYDICGLPAQDGEDNTVWIHRDDDAVIVYFRFER